jgi:hypothetical protein
LAVQFASRHDAIRPGCGRPGAGAEILGPGPILESHRKQAAVIGILATDTEGLPTDTIDFHAPLEAVIAIEAVVAIDPVRYEGVSSEAIGSCKS